MLAWAVWRNQILLYTSEISMYSMYLSTYLFIYLCEIQKKKDLKEEEKKISKNEWFKSWKMTLKKNFYLVLNECIYLLSMYLHM